MDRQLTFADSEFSSRRRQTRNEKFPGRMDNAIPDHSTIRNFRHLLGRRGPARRIFDEVKQWLSEAAMLLKQGALIDATHIEAPNSTRNKTGENDPEMHQAKNGNTWYFGTKAHIGVDARTGLTHSFTTTAANEHDLNQAHRLLQREDACVFAEAGEPANKSNGSLAFSAGWNRGAALKACWWPVEKRQQRVLMATTAPLLFQSFHFTDHTARIHMSNDIGRIYNA